MKTFYEKWNANGKKIQVVAFSADKKEDGFNSSIKDFPWVQRKYGEDYSAIEAKIPCKHYPLPGVINAKTGDVIVENAWGKVEEGSLQGWLDQCK